MSELLKALQEVEELKIELNNYQLKLSKTEREFRLFQRKFEETHPYGFFITKECDSKWKIEIRDRSSYWESRLLSDSELIKRVQYDLFNLMKGICNDDM